MPSVSTLNVRITANASEFFRTVNRLERDLRNFGRRMSYIGSEITQSVSLPLIGFGVAAVRAAGDIQALRLALETTFQNSGRSIEEARLELEALRKVALAPGIDFEQAVKGSIRLQNVGYSAEAAREILIQLANAIALTGGSAIELDGVTRQFAQIIAKGRILQEDLTIIQENMPAIGQALKNAFGTSSAERLRELGVTTEELIKQVTYQLAKLPRVGGGIKNTIVNFFASLKIELAAFGDAIDKAINLEDVSARILSFLSSVRRGFEALPAGVQGGIVKAVAALALLGPALKIAGGYALVLSRAFAGFKFLGSAALEAAKAVIAFSQALIKSSAAAAVFSAIRTAFLAALSGAAAFAQGVQAMAVSMFNAIRAAYGLRAAIIAATGGAALIITGVVLAVQALASAFDTASDAQKAFEEGQRSVLSQYAKEEQIISRNFSVLKDATSSIEARKQAISELTARYPNYLNALDLEKASISQLSALQKEVSEQTLKRLAIQQKEAALADLRVKEIEAIRKLSDLRAQGGFIFKDTALANATRELEKVRAEIREVEVSFDRAFGLGAYGAKSFEEAIGAVTRSTGIFAAYKPKIGEVVAKDAEALASGAQKGKEYFDALFGESISKYSSSTEAVSQASKRMAQVLKDVNAGLRAQDEKIKITGETFDYLRDRANFLERAIDKLLKAGFDSGSEEVKKFRDLLDEVNNKINNQVEEYKKLRQFWSSPVKIPEPIIPAIKLPTITGALERDLTSALTASFERAQEAADKRRSVRLKPGARKDVEIKIPEISTSSQIGALTALNEAIEKVRESAPRINFNNLTDAQKVFERFQKGYASFSEAFAAATKNAREEALAFGASISDSFTLAAQKANDFGAGFAQLRGVFALVAADMFEWGASIEAIGRTLERVGAGVAELWLSVADAITSATEKSLNDFQSISKSFNDIASAAASAALKVVRAWIQQGVAAAVAKALSAKVPFPINLALAATAGAAAAVLFTGALKAIRVPFLAEGGVIRRPTLAVLGEYAGATRDPEIVIRQSRLKKAIEEAPAPKAAMQKINALSPKEPASISSLGSALMRFNLNNKGSFSSNSIFTKIPRVQVPKLASGGVLRRSTLVLAGEYTNATTNPEIVSPASLIREIVREEAGGTLTATVRGEDLLFLLDRARARKNRTL